MWLCEGPALPLMLPMAKLAKSPGHQDSQCLLCGTSYLGNTLIEPRCSRSQFPSV